MEKRSRKLRIESLESRRLMAVVQDASATGVFDSNVAADPFESRRVPAVLHNAALPGDVDGNGIINPLDALIVLNACTPKRGNLPVGIPPLEAKPIYLDVNRDGGVTVRDALAVLNRIREALMPAPAMPAEGENVLPVQVDVMRSNRLGTLSATVHRTAKPLEFTTFELIESRVEAPKRPTVASKTDQMLGVCLSESRVETEVGPTLRPADRR
jgi:hypothetical protein